MGNKYWPVLFVANLCVHPVQAMGLRSFVALPVDKDGKVVRIQYQRNADTHTDVLVTNAAYGLNGKQTLLCLDYRTGYPQLALTGQAI